MLMSDFPSTDRKIVDMLPDRAPQVTFTCDIPSETCGFQFWIGRVESFYCGLSNCTTRREVQYGANTTEYRCEKVECACIPGKMLCGENGSVGECCPPILLGLRSSRGDQSSPCRAPFVLPDITDFLAEEIKGPGKFTTKTGEPSRFEEPAMNQLINDIFGDTFITLKCNSGECMRRGSVPGFLVRHCLPLVLSEQVCFSPGPC